MVKRWARSLICRYESCLWILSATALCNGLRLACSLQAGPLGEGFCLSIWKRKFTVEQAYLLLTPAFLKVAWCSCDLKIQERSWIPVKRKILGFFYSTSSFAVLRISLVKGSLANIYTHVFCMGIHSVLFSCCIIWKHSLCSVLELKLYHRLFKNICCLKKTNAECSVLSIWYLKFLKERSF